MPISEFSNKDFRELLQRFERKDSGDLRAAERIEELEEENKGLKARVSRIESEMVIATAAFEDMTQQLKRLVLHLDSIKDENT